MTAIVGYAGHPDRLACERCGCDVAARREGEPWRTVLPEGRHGAGFDTWTHILDVDEPAVHLDLDDGCPCHESYLRVMKHAYARSEESE